MGFDFIVIAPLLPSHCGFSSVWMWGIFFGEFQYLPVNDCSAVSCDSSALARGSERISFYSAILNQSYRVFLSSQKALLDSTALNIQTPTMTITLLIFSLSQYTTAAQQSIKVYSDY